jgi:hypothetical protein
MIRIQAAGIPDRSVAWYRVFAVMFFHRLAEHIAYGVIKEQVLFPENVWDPGKHRRRPFFNRIFR